jgi:hypothetical protein
VGCGNRVEKLRRRKLNCGNGLRARYVVLRFVMRGPDLQIMAELATAGYSAGQIAEIFKIFEQRRNADAMARTRAATREPGTRKRIGRPPGVAVSADAVPEPDRTRDAVACGLSVSEVAGVFAAFLDHNKAEGRTSGSWPERWRGWCRHHLARTSRPASVRVDPNRYTPKPVYEPSDRMKRELAAEAEAKRNGR